MLTSSSDKVVSGCSLVYRNVFLTVSIQFQSLKKLHSHTVVNSLVQTTVYLSLYEILADVRLKVFVTQLSSSTLQQLTDRT